MDLSYRITRTYQNGKTEKCYGDMYLHAKNLDRKVKEEMRRQLLNEEKMADPSIESVDFKWLS